MVEVDLSPLETDQDVAASRGDQRVHAVVVVVVGEEGDITDYNVRTTDVQIVLSIVDL
jgi:hypothetical protein